MHHADMVATVTGLTAFKSLDWVDLDQVTVTGYQTVMDSTLGWFRIRNSVLANADDVSDDLGVVGEEACGGTIRWSLISDGDCAGFNGNLAGEPQFVDAAAGDVHLVAGSPGVDAGDPASPYGNEPEPNGCRVNMGAWGNTAGAELSTDPDGDGLYGACPPADLLEVTLTAALSGTNLLITDQVRNAGLGDAAASEVRYYLSTNNTFEEGTDTLLCSRAVPALAAGGAEAQAVLSTCPVPNVAWGQYSVIARVDAAGVVTEQDEANNTSAAAVSITGKDLVPTALTASRSGNVKVLVSDTVKNQGSKATGAKITIRYYLSTDTTWDATDPVLASSSNGTGTCQRSPSSLGAGASSSISNKTCYKPATGVQSGVGYYVLVVDDVTGVVAEYNESNNVRATAGMISW